MSLYHALFGENGNQKNMLLALLGKKSHEFGRYRDIYVTNSHIVVHTRNGGGNREDFEHVFEEMSEHPLYDYDEDDDFDCTYANIYFKHPPEYTELLKEMAEHTVTPSEKWQALLLALEPTSNSTDN